MIPDIGRGSRTHGLLVYLYGPGRREEHADAHLVGSWDGFAPDPGRDASPDPDPKVTLARLTAALDLRVKQAADRAPAKHVWHCSVRTAPGDRRLSDEEWNAVAQRIVHATGVAPNDDPDGCRWIAVRHAEDHIHIVATLVRGDLRNPRLNYDFNKAQAVCRSIEKEMGIRRLNAGDGTAAKNPTSAEKFKAERTGRPETSRETLREAVRRAAAGADDEQEFFTLLHEAGLRVKKRTAPSGDTIGYNVALPGDSNRHGEPIWYAGSKLAPDLSLPKIRKRLDAIDQQGPRSANPWHHASAASERIPHRLQGDDDAAAQAHLAAFGEALDALPLIAPRTVRPHLRQAAKSFERATRSRIQAEHHHARVLRGAVRAMVRQPVPRDGALLAMFLDAAVLVVIAAARWHQTRHHDQQVVAAQRTLLHLQTAYEQTAGAPLVVLAQRRPPQQVVERHILLVRQAVPDHAEQVLQDPAFDALVAVLADAEKAGHDPAQLLQQAADQRAMDDARRPARVLTWRVERLSARTVPSARARAAQARSTAHRSGTPVPSPPVAAATQPRPLQARRR